MSAFSDRKKTLKRVYWNLFERTHTAKGTSEQQEALERSPLRCPSYQALAMRRSRVCVECVCGCACNRSQPEPQPAIRCTTTAAIQIALVVASIPHRNPIEHSAGHSIKRLSRALQLLWANRSAARGWGWVEAGQGRGGNYCWNSIRQQWKRRQVYGNSLKTFLGWKFAKEFSSANGK